MLLIELPPKFEHLPWKLANQIRPIPANGPRNWVPAIFQVPLPTKKVLPRILTNQMSARVSRTKVCGCHRGVKWFLPPWKLIFTTAEIDFWSFCYFIIIIITLLLLLLFYHGEIQSIKWRYKDTKGVEYIQASLLNLQASVGNPPHGCRLVHARHWSVGHRCRWEGCHLYHKQGHLGMHLWGGQIRVRW